MNIQEFYVAIGEDYSAVLERLGSEKLVKKVALEFLSDPSFASLCRGLEQKDVEMAFRAVHTLKGVAANLGFERLFQASYALTECLRPRKLEGYELLFAQVKDRYEEVVAQLKKLAESSNENA